MTREKAIVLLRSYKHDEYGTDRRIIVVSARDPEIRRAAYGQTLIDNLIRKIRESPNDPILTVGQHYCELDWALGEADEKQTQMIRFLAIMEHECGNVLRYLKQMDKGR